MHLQTHRDNPTDEESKSNRTEETAVGSPKSSHGVGTTAMHRPQGKCPTKQDSCRRCNKVGHFASVCRRPTGRANTIDEDYSSDNEEGLDQDMHLLHVTYLEVNGVNDKSAGRETDEWLESVKV